MDVLFVCLENVCRSPMAQVVAQQWGGAPAAGARPRHRFASAGTRAALPGAPLDARARAALERRGYRAGRHRARGLTPADLDRHDLVVVMDRGCLEVVRRMCGPDQLHKVSMLLDWVAEGPGGEVPDPYFGPASGFDTVLELCEQGIAGLHAGALTTTR